MCFDKIIILATRPGFEQVAVTKIKKNTHRILYTLIVDNIIMMI